MNVLPSPPEAVIPPACEPSPDEFDFHRHTLALKRMLAQHLRLMEIDQQPGAGANPLLSPQPLPRLERAASLHWHHTDRFGIEENEGRFDGWAFVPAWSPADTTPFLLFHGSRDFLVPLLRRSRPDVAAAYREQNEIRDQPVAPHLADTGLVARFALAPLRGFRGSVHVCLVHRGETAAVCCIPNWSVGTLDDSVTS